MPVEHVGHAELVVTDLDASTRFFTELIGLHISAQEDGRVFLRAWQDFDHHTLVLTEGAQSGLAHLGWRVATKEAAEGIAAELDRRGVSYRWSECLEGSGHGDSLVFATPGGIPFELYWEVERYQAPPELRSLFPSHPSQVPTRGVGPRRFDHATFFVTDPVAEQRFLTEALGIYHRYYGETPDGQRIGSWLSRTNVSHEIAVGRNAVGGGGVLHHVAYYAESAEDVLRGATMLVDHGYELDFGPGRHGTSGATFLYFREPSGNRIELWTGGLLIFAPDWEPVPWTDPDIVMRGLGDFWNSCQMSENFQSGTALLPTVAGSAA